MLDFEAADRCCCGLWASQPWPPVVWYQACCLNICFFCFFCEFAVDPCCRSSTSSHAVPVHQRLAGSSPMSHRGQHCMTCVVSPGRQVADHGNTKQLYSSQNQQFCTLNHYVSNKTRENRLHVEPILQKQGMGENRSAPLPYLVDQKRGRFFGGYYVSVCILHTHNDFVKYRVPNPCYY